MHTRVLLSRLVLFSLLASCNMPVGQTPVAQPPANQPVSLDPGALATAVELTAIARVTAIAGSAVPGVPTSTATPTATVAGASAPTQCTPMVTATVAANVRYGPDTSYGIVGSLGLGQTAAIVGRNDAYTWWYIDYPAGSGNHAWIAGSVVNASCVPSVVQVVAAPPSPTAVVAQEPSSGDSGDSSGNNLQVVPPVELNPVLLLPDLIVVGIQLDPSSPLSGNAVTVKVKVKNQGPGDAGFFKVNWWSSPTDVSCGWQLASLAAGASEVLVCSHTFDAVGSYSIKATVDTGAAVTETDEGNNTAVGVVQVKLNLKIVPRK